MRAGQSYKNDIMYFRRRRRYLTETPGTLKDKLEQAAESINQTAIFEKDREELAFLEREEANLVTPESVRHKSKHHQRNKYNIREHTDLRPDRVKTAYFSVYDRNSGYTPKVLDFGTPTRPTKTIMPTYVKKHVARPSKFRSQIGSRKKHHVRKNLRTFTVTSFGDKNLIGERLLYAPYNADEKVIGARNGIMIHSRGVRLKKWFNLASLATIGDAKYQRPITIRWAVVNPRDNNGQTTFPVDDFFMSRQPTVKPWAAFSQTGNSMYYLSSKINRDNFAVLKEGKFELQMGTDQVRFTNRSQKLIDIWLPFNRTIEFADNETTIEAGHPTENIYFLYWACASNDPNTLPSFSGANEILSTWSEVTNYFTNTSLYN